MSAYGIIVFIMLLMYTFYMGFNGGSNAIATTVVTRAIEVRTAIIISAIIKFIVPVGMWALMKWGVSLFSVASNIGTKMIYPTYFAQIVTEKAAFAFMFSGLLGAMIWALISYFTKVPISISHTLLGGVFGAAIAAFDTLKCIQWKETVAFDVMAMILIAPAIAMVLGFLLMKFAKRMLWGASRRAGTALLYVQKVNFVILAGAFASNNSQKALGVVVLMGSMGLLGFNGMANIPFWAVACVGLALMLGMLGGGYRIMNTIGRKLFKVEPIHSVVAQLTTSIITLTGNFTGIPLGMGQAMTASVIGAGAADRIKAVNWSTAGKITIGWTLTMPIAMGIGAASYYLCKLILKI